MDNIILSNYAINHDAFVYSQALCMLVASYDIRYMFTFQTIIAMLTHVPTDIGQ